MKIKKKKKVAPPKRKGYASEQPKETEDSKILSDAQKALKELIDDESEQREQMQDDLRFCTLDQWPDDIRRERENDTENGPRPCLTIDKINQYIVQVANDLKQGKPGINVRPQDDFADVETAKVLKGIVRNIEDQSSADIAYGTAAENMVKMGLGYFRITTEYVSEDSFDQDIFIRPIPNTFAVYLGKHLMPDGSDAERGYIVESMPDEKFKAEFPKAKCEKKDFDGVSGEMLSFWKSENTTTVVEEYVIEKTSMTLHFLADGTTISSADYDAWPEEAGAKPTIQDSRTTTKCQLKWRKMTAVEVLDKRDLPGKFIPIVEMVGREALVAGKRVLWGLVRPAKDSLRMYNYWASLLTEKFGLAPKTPFIGAVGQFATQAERWKKANRVNYAYLEYDLIDTVTGNALPAPQRQGPTPMEAAFFHQMQVIEHDVQTSLGMFKAAVGETESQQSGRAILALQRESDTGTYHFSANQSISIRHGGRIILDLIPHYYDTKRIVRILGEDGEMQTAQIDPQQDVAHKQIQTPGGIKSIHNPNLGKYDISITVGPSYNTKRMESAATFVELAKGASDPGSAAVLRYLTVRNSDFPGSDEAAKMMRALLPPQVQQAIAQGSQQIPPQVQAQLQQMNQQIQMMHEAGNKLAAENQQLKAGQQEGMAKIQATREAKMAELALEREVQAARIAMEREKAEADIQLERAKAIAQLEIEKMKIDANADADVDMAIAKIANLATVHQTKVQGMFDREAASRDAAAAGAETAQAEQQDNAGQVQALQQQFQDTIRQIVGALTAKKTINLIHQNGQPIGAEVSMQQ